ncbi:MAG: hypothetical protein IJQ57_06570 [Synergistaceae bacterium]|nr:hypothetical protein [Synergistaceae bacterium]
MNRIAGDIDLLEYILSSFSCLRDEDIQNFLRKRAIDFEKLLKSRTYLVIDEEQFENQNFALKDLTIYGYISLAVKVFTVPETTSNRQRQQLDGFSAKEHGKQISNFPCYLIGQLARNSNVPKEIISGAELLQVAYNIIGEAVKLVGGRNILVECHNDKRLVQFYLDNGFYKVSQVPDENQNMIQLIRRIEFGGYAS